MKNLIWLGLLFFSLTGMAADNPVDVIQSDQAQQTSCLENKTNQCIEGCTHSEDINCTADCKNKAQAECEVDQDE